MTRELRAPPEGERFAERLVGWHRRHGRHDLPWQRTPSRYRIWISEVMLQQTRVETVAGYFDRFIARFPDLRALAAADLDEVLHLWSGLGYYARARNLHAAARTAAAEHGGELPADLDALVALPGIGRSTAGAILALADGQRHPILDGNVKRVLARCFAVEGWPGQNGVARELWALAERLTPATDVAAYTQAIMDLGATLCTRARPRCEHCPLRTGCIAHRTGRVAELPAPRPRRALPVRRRCAVVARDPGGALLLERRAPTGIWGGLWSFPECGDAAPTAWCREHLGIDPAGEPRALAPLVHTFTHFRLELEPWLVEVRDPRGAARVADDPDLRWYRPGGRISIGLAAPVERVAAGLAGGPRAGRRAARRTSGILDVSNPEASER